MEKVKGIPQLVIIGSTNQISNIDPCLLKFGLFDRKVEFKQFTTQEQEHSIDRSQQRLQETRRTNKIDQIVGNSGIFFFAIIVYYYFKRNASM